MNSFFVECLIMSNKRKRQLFLIFNAILPLFCGLMIYIFLKSGTYINSLIHIDFNYHFKTVLGFFIINWFCDFLWSYALVFALYFVLLPFKNNLLISCVLSAFLGILLEILQGMNLLSGTFDWWDIIIEITAVIIATLVIKSIDKKDGSWWIVL